MRPCYNTGKSPVVAVELFNPATYHLSDYLLENDISAAPQVEFPVVPGSFPVKVSDAKNSSNARQLKISADFKVPVPDNSGNFFVYLKDFVRLGVVLRLRYASGQPEIYGYYEQPLKLTYTKTERPGSDKDPEVSIKIQGVIVARQ